MEEVRGSIPLSRTRMWAASDNGSTSVLHAEGRGSIPRRSTKILMGHVYGVAGDPCKIAVIGFDSRVLHQRIFHATHKACGSTVNARESGSIPERGAKIR